MPKLQAGMILSFNSKQSENIYSSSIPTMVASTLLSWEIIRSIPIPILVVRCLDRKLILSNTALAKLLRFPTEDLILTKPLDYFFPLIEISTILNRLEIGKELFHETLTWTDYYGETLSVLGMVKLVSIEQTNYLIVYCYSHPQPNPTYSQTQSEKLLLQNYFPGITYQKLNNPQGTFLKLSENCYPILGYHPHQLLKNFDFPSQILIDPEHRSRVEEKIQIALKKYQPYTLEYRLITAKGERKWILDQGKGVYNLIGELEYIEGLMIDITQQKQAENERELLKNLTQIISEAQDFHTALEEALKALCQVTGWTIGEVWLPNSQKKVLECSTAFYCQVLQEIDTNSNSYYSSLQEFREISQSLQFKLGEGLPGIVWLTQEPKWIPDVSQDIEFVRHQSAKKAGLKAGFAIPIIAHEQVVAVLVFFLSQSLPHDQEFIALVTTITTQLGTLIELKRTEEALRQAEAKYRSIVENSLEGIFQTSINGHYLSANPALARLYGYSSPEVLMQELTDIKNQLYVHPQKRDEFITILQEKGTVSGFESQVYRRDGTIIWISENARSVYNQQGEVIYYEGRVEDITERKINREHLQFRACYDPLTKLANRGSFMEKLQDVLHHCKFTIPMRHFAVLFLDLDRFKVINDSLGHLVGDELLVAIAQRLKHCVREGDMVARLGGDEFTIILENVTQLDMVILIAERIKIELEKPFILSGHQIFTGTSIGIFYSNYCPLDYDPELMFDILEKTPEDVLRDADTALYSAKSSGKGCYKIFDRTMHQNAVLQLEKETDLRSSLPNIHFENQNNPFELYYQPILQLRSKKIIGFEALLRWNHPHKGLLLPSDFLETAEETGLIISLEKWVINQACYQLKEWQNLHPHRVSLTMNINLSGQLFNQEDIVYLMGSIIQKHQLNPQDLSLEISEKIWLNTVDFCTAKLQQLHQQNIRLCLDDFGMGYSSLNALHEFPIQGIKIDRTFIQQITQKGKKREIARTLFTVAHTLGLEVIAEGIETEEQLEQLCKMNCQYGQGYLFYPPLPKHQVTELLTHY